MLYEVVQDIEAPGQIHPRYSVAAVFAVVEAPDGPGEKDSPIVLFPAAGTTDPGQLD